MGLTRRGELLRSGRGEAERGGGGLVRDGVDACPHRPEAGRARFRPAAGYARPPPDRGARASFLAEYSSTWGRGEGRLPVGWAHVRRRRKPAIWTRASVRSRPRPVGQARRIGAQVACSGRCAEGRRATWDFLSSPDARAPPEKAAGVGLCTGPCRRPHRSDFSRPRAFDSMASCAESRLSSLALEEPP